MEINFGTNVSKCAIIFDVNGNYTINNANMRIISNQNWNGQVAFPNGITWARVDAYASELTNHSNAFNAKTSFPNTITSLYQCFQNRGKFNKPVNIPNSVTNTVNMFYACANLNQNIQIPNSVTNTTNMFRNCTNLNQNIQIPDSVQVTYGTFYYCKKLNQNIKIPNSAQNIASMFFGCSDLNFNIQIPNTVRNATFVFSNCTSLNQNIKIPDSITAITGIFDGCYNLNQNIKIPSNFGGNLFTIFRNCSNLDQNILFPSMKNLQSDNAWFAFRGCNNLSNVTLRNGTVNNMFTGAFRFNNAKRLNIWTDLTTATNLITTKIIHPNNTNVKIGTQILPTWTTITNGYYNELYNIYIYTNAVFPS